MDGHRSISSLYVMAGSPLPVLSISAARIQTIWAARLLRSFMILDFTAYELTG